MLRFWRRTPPPPLPPLTQAPAQAGAALPVTPRIVPLASSAVAEALLVNGLKLDQYVADRSSEDPGAPTVTPEGASGDASPLAVATVDATGSPNVPADLAHEVRELQNLPDAPGASPAGGIALPGEQLPSASRTQAIARAGGLHEPSRATASILRGVEAVEVRVLRAAGAPRATVFAVALQRAIAIAPPGHYKGVLGAARRARLWWRVNGASVAYICGGVVLGTGLLALCVFCPIVGIIIAANLILISCATAGAARTGY